MFSAKHLSTVRNQTHRVGADFLRIDSEVGLTFCRMSLSETDREGRRRMTRIARRAYDSIMLLSLQIELTDSEAIELDRNLSRLKGQLQDLGEAF